MGHEEPVPVSHGKEIRMIIMGIDPGFAIAGYGIIEYSNNKFRAIDHGAVTTKASTPLPQRLRILGESIDELILRHSPDAIAIEELFFNNNAKTAINVAQGRGVIVYCAAKSAAKIFEYTPLEVKQTVTGYGRADKIQVQNMVKSILKITSISKLDDVSDALAIAICHAHFCNSLAVFRK